MSHENFFAIAGGVLRLRPLFLTVLYCGFIDVSQKRVRNLMLKINSE